MVAAVDGEVDLLTVDVFDTEIARVMNDPCNGFVVDLTTTTFFSAAGMRVLRRVQRDRRAGQLFAVAAPDHIARPMRLIGLDAEISIHPTVDLALSCLANTGADRAAS